MQCATNTFNWQIMCNIQLRLSGLPKNTTRLVVHTIGRWGCPTRVREMCYSTGGDHFILLKFNRVDCSAAIGMLKVLVEGFQ